MLKQYPSQIKIAFKHFPLRSHAYATKAAQASMAANIQGKFWEFHDLLFKNYKTLNDRRVEEISAQLGLDAGQLRREMQAPHIMAHIKADVNNGRQAGVRGTPTIYINGRLLRSKTLTGFQQSINQELQRMKR